MASKRRLRIPGCMPFPLSALCWLDERLHGKHDGRRGVICAVHDNAMIAWMRLQPRTESKYTEKVRQEQ